MSNAPGPFSTTSKLLAAAGLALVAALAAGMIGLPGWFHRETVSFNEDIRPILNSRCMVCHGGIKREAGLSFLFNSDALGLTESGKRAIVPGNSGKSELIRRVKLSDPEQRMPLEGEPLTAEEIRRLELWIDQGAEWADHWAYVKPEPIELPRVSDASWPGNGIDYFILARLEEEGLEPSPRADPRTLIRRVSLDLTGLPPTPEEVEAFCSDSSPGAYDKVVDRLLASKRFGEHWASMWLDLARYADTKGYEADYHRTIWKYRDWVIQAFNEDKPFDEFTIEQLAGDLLPQPNRDQLIATAFHRNTMTNTEGGTVDEEYRSAAVIDRVNTTMEVWQGTTMQCVQCHSHPYDPFRHKEYYQLFAFFNNTQDFDQPDERPTLPTSADEEKQKKIDFLTVEVEEIKAEMEAAAAQPENVIKLQEWVKAAREALKSTSDRDLIGVMEIPEEMGIEEIIKKPRAQRQPIEQRLLTEYYMTFAPELASLQEKLEAKQKQLEELEPVLTPIMRELPQRYSRIARVFERGNWMVRREVVQPGVPESLNPLPERTPRNRLGLAQWLLSPENPLTARVAVNRFWHELFGVGIVETLEDFGTRGERPSHPELLDWLALQFIHEQDWSMKSLLRQIVLSAAYRQSSQVKPEHLEKDPRNRLLARAPRVRLSAEQIRDQALFVGGLLSEKMFGPGVMPPQPPGIWNSPYNNSKWEVSEGEDQYRRALYTFWKRTSPYPSMVTFDEPSHEVTVSRRIPTNTPLQALVTLNDPVYVEAAQGLARRMGLEQSERPDDKIMRGYEIALARRPDQQTLGDLIDLYRGALEQCAEDADPQMAALTAVAGAIMNLDSFIMKE
ncbi:MAG: PSD1 and planctomycete cytochrome C domain-containing protein [Acidobacteriota bacterium]